MQKKKMTWQVKGMNRDLSPSKASSEAAFEIKNLRISSNEGNTMLSWTSVKGLQSITIAVDSCTNKSVYPQTNVSFEGTILGYAVLNHQLVVFTHNDSSDDRIYLFKYDEGTNNFTEKFLIFRSNLNLHTDHPIETLVSYESESVQKVYWTDGYNQPRVINIAASNMAKYSTCPHLLDFLPTIAPCNESVTITKVNSGGIFTPGTIQYMFTYFNSNGQETNIAYQSPLYYISHENRGADTVENVACSFNIQVNSVNTDFEYLRLYSVHYTSEESYEARIVGDFNTGSSLSNTDSSLSFVDGGYSGYTIDPNILRYVGGIPLKAETMSEKDNTLFLGNIEESSYSGLMEYIQNKIISIQDTGSEGNYISLRYTYVHNDHSKDASYYTHFDHSAVRSYKSSLSKNSYEMTTFKEGQTYRFGVQLQTKTGEWLSPIWLKDIRNNLAPDVNTAGDVCRLPFARGNISNFFVNSWMQNYCNEHHIPSITFEDTFKSIRPVIVFPEPKDYEVICQGILNPTVFNLADRKNNSPYAQSSWFYRPNIKYTDPAYGINNLNGATYKLGMTPRYKHWEPLCNAVCNQEFVIQEGETTTDLKFCQVKSFKDAELQYMDEHEQVYGRKYESSSERITDELITDEVAKRWFFVDRNILTLDSPDITFNEGITDAMLSGCKLRIVGYAPITSSSSTYHIYVNSGKVDSRTVHWPTSYYWDLWIKAPYRVITNFSWLDGWVYKYQTDGTNEPYRTGTDNMYPIYYPIYPWQRDGSLTADPRGINGGYSNLDNKILSTILISSNTLYYWVNSGDYYTECYDLYSSKVCRKSDIDRSYSLNGAKRYKNVNNEPVYTANRVGINYNPNINTTIAAVDSLAQVGGEGVFLDSCTRVYTASAGDNGFVQDDLRNPNNHGDCGIADVSPYPHWQKVVLPDYNYVRKDIITMKYKSGDHAVLVLARPYRILNGEKRYSGDSGLGLDGILPEELTVQGSSTDTPPFEIKRSPLNFADEKDLYWLLPAGENDGTKELFEGGFFKVKTGQPLSNMSFLFVGELYRDLSGDTIFGGKNIAAFKSNNWLVAGKAAKIISNEVNSTLYWDYGDTYYQRYDHIHTYPYSKTDTNQIMEVASFMCETRINLDGRYDANRGLEDVSDINDENFNLMNPVYSRKDNFLIQKQTSGNDSGKYPNWLCYSKTKTAGEKIDSYTHITTTSSYNLDGNKGEIRALRRLDNQLLAFQDTGIAQIMYNEHTALSTTEGLPVEIANSGKLSGVKYVSDTIGCSNKWSIASSPKGLYFVDALNKNIWKYNGEFHNLSQTRGFDSWAKSNIKVKESYNPTSSTVVENDATYYDKLHSEVLFRINGQLLAYSDIFDMFTSFYDYGTTYGNLAYYLGIDSSMLMLSNGNSPYICNPNISTSYLPYSMTLIGNPDPLADKIFTNLEFRASVDGDGSTTTEGGETVFNKFYLPFDKLEAWDEYQHGITTLSIMNGHNAMLHGGTTSSLKRKFRIWRCDIPRDNAELNTDAALGISRYSRRPNDRMRNPWLYLKLDSASSDVKKMELHDISMDYYS